jgi:hypothetical protein
MHIHESSTSVNRLSKVKASGSPVVDQVEPAVTSVKRLASEYMKQRLSTTPGFPLLANQIAPSARLCGRSKTGPATLMTFCVLRVWMHVTVDRVGGIIHNM